jgi:hypothetical protein
LQIYFCNDSIIGWYENPKFGDRHSLTYAKGIHTLPNPEIVI